MHSQLWMRLIVHRASNMIPFWSALHETLAVVAQDQRGFPQRQPISHDQGHMARLTGLRHVEETMVPVPRPHDVGSLSACKSNRLRGCHSGRSTQGLWE